MVVVHCAAAGSESVPGFPSWLSIIAGVGPWQAGLRLRLRPQDGAGIEPAHHEGDGFSVVELSGELLEVGGHPGQFACGL